MANTSIIRWLNHVPACHISMQNDGVYGLLSWRDMSRNATLDVFEFQHMLWMTVLALGVPLAVFI